MIGQRLLTRWYGAEAVAAVERGSRSKRKRAVVGRVSGTCLFLAFLVAVFAVPIGAIDHRVRQDARALQTSGSWHDVAQVREVVGRHHGRSSTYYSVDRVLVTYDDGATARTVAVEGFSQDTGRTQPGTYVTYDRADDATRERVRVSADGRRALLEDDYDDTLSGEFDGVYRGFAVWVAVWSVLGLTALVLRRRHQVVHGVRHGSLPRFALSAVGVYAAVLGVLWLASYPLDALSHGSL